MRTVWKHEIFTKAEFTINLPFGAKPLMIDVQNQQPYLWVEVDTEIESLIPRHFCVFGTGRGIPKRFDIYIGSWAEVPFVWHLYAVGFLGEFTGGD